MKSDRLLLSGAILFLLLQLIWLGADLKIFKVPWLSDFQTKDKYQQVGIIASTQNNTRQKSDSEIIWHDGSENENVYTHDALLTLKNSAMKIKMNNGSELNLSENTLVYIEPIDENQKDQRIRIRFAHGSLRSKLSDMVHELKADSWEINAASGTEIQIKAMESGKLELDVSKGQAVATGQGQSVQVNSGEMVELGTGKNLQDKKKFSSTVQWSESKDKVRVYAHSFPAFINMHWKGEGDSIEFHRDGALVKRIPVSKTQTEAKVILEEGTYEARLVSATGFSSWMNVEVWQAPVIHLMSPLPRDRYSESENFSYIWLKPESVKSSHWQISPEDKFSRIESQWTTDESELSQSRKPASIREGKYHWRVLGYDSEGFEIPAPYSNPIYIVPDPLAAPELTAPEIRRPLKPDSTRNFPRESPKKLLSWFFHLLISEAKAEDSTPDNKAFESRKTSIVLKWSEVEGADRYILEISENPDFRELVVEKKLSTNSFEWKNIKLHEGVFYWRVASDSVHRMGKFSSVAEVHVRDLYRGVKYAGIEIHNLTPEPAPTETPVPPTPVPVATAPEPPPTPPVVINREPQVAFTLDISYEYDFWKDAAATTYTLSGPTAKAFYLNEKLENEQIKGLFVDGQWTMWKNVNNNSFQNGSTVNDFRLRLLGTRGSQHSHWTAAAGVTLTGMFNRAGLESAGVSEQPMLSFGEIYHFGSDGHYQGIFGFSLSTNVSLTEAALLFHSYKTFYQSPAHTVIGGPEMEISEFFGNQSSGSRFMLGYGFGYSW